MFKDLHLGQKIIFSLFQNVSILCCQVDASFDEDVGKKINEKRTANLRCHGVQLGCESGAII